MGPEWGSGGRRFESSRPDQISLLFPDTYGEEEVQAKSVKALGCG